MKTFYLVIALLIAETGTAQQVTRKVKWGANNSKEVYYVLSSDTSILHGRYERIEKNARSEGFYNQGLQDGIWTEYSLRPKKFIRVQGPYKNGLRNGLWTVYYDKRKLKSKGYYTNDKRTGFWRFYNEKGEIDEEGNFVDGFRNGSWSFYDDKGVLTQEYDYSSRKILSDISLNELLQTKFKVINGTDTVLTLLQRPPLYIGGRGKLCKPKTILMPMKHDSMKVQVRFTIDKYGQPHNFHITDTVGRFYDRQALFMVRQLTASWMPAVLNDEPVEVEHTLTVLFKRTETMAAINSPGTYYVRTPATQPGQFGTSRPVFLPPPRPVAIPSTKIQIL